MDTLAKEPTDTKIDRIKTIASLSAKHIAINAQKQRVSRRLQIAKHNEKITVNCEISGITCLMDIPAIPGYSLIWTSPISSVANCRGMVSLGLSYLRKLDTQILAGMLVVIADDYSLFTYQPSDSGAQKNAVIRTAGKDTIINALLLIEDFVHSNNVMYLPRLSLIMDTVVEQSGIEARMTEWMKTVAAYILRAEWADSTEDTSPEDSFYNEAPKKTLTASYSKDAQKQAKKEDWAKQNKKWAEQREYKADIKVAKEILKTLASTETISTKLHGLLKSIFTEDSLLTMDSAMRYLVASKMEGFESLASTKLVAILKKDYPLLREASISLDIDLEAEDTIPSSKEDASMLTDQAEGNSIDVTLDTTIEIGEAPAIEIMTVSEVITATVEANPLNKLSLIERIKLKKQQAARELEAASIALRNSLPQTITPQLGEQE
jgi:hypothetical protein